MSKQLEGRRLVFSRQKTFVATIMLAVDVSSMRGAVKLFGTVFCGCTIVAAVRRAIVETIGPAVVYCTLFPRH